MLPPLAPDILESNPNFAILYKHLTKHVLSTDGSTLSKQKSYTDTRIEKDLHDARLSSLRNGILIQGLKEIAFTLSNDNNSHDGTDLDELVYTISEYLDNVLSPSSATNDTETAKLMSYEITQFKAHLPEITTTLSRHFIDIEHTLSLMANCIDINSNINVKHPASTTLSSSLTTQNHYIQQIQTTLLPTLLAQLSHLTHSLLTYQNSTLHTLIRHLELTTHGTTSRHTTSKSQFLRTVSEAIALKTHVGLLSTTRDVYSDTDTIDALKSLDEELNQKEIYADRRIDELERLLDLYEKEGMQRMKTLGERYGEVESEIEIIRNDSERLEKDLNV